MNLQLVIGLLALGYGLFTLVARFAMPHSNLFRKLEPMRQQFGHTAGTALHWLGYTVLPLVFGSVKLAQVLLP